jgi:hypothetical protein
MDGEITPLEELWGELLSREPDRVVKAISGLNDADRSAVLAHLQRMVSEPGWHDEQRVSARCALESLEELDN